MFKTFAAKTLLYITAQGVKIHEGGKIPAAFAQQEDAAAAFAAGALAYDADIAKCKAMTGNEKNDCLHAL